MRLGRKHFESDYEFLQYCAARDIWGRLDHKTPSRKRTWRQWFEGKFGRDYEEYVRSTQATADRLSTRHGNSSQNASDRGVR